MEGRFNTNWWNRIRNSIRHLANPCGIRVSFKYTENKIRLQIYELCKDNYLMTGAQKKRTSKVLRNYYHAYHFNNWKTRKNTDKSAEELAACPSYSSKIVFRGEISERLVYDSLYKSQLPAGQCQA